MTEKEKAFILGTLIGDALGLPINHKPHHIVRMYFKGIKGYTDEYYSTATSAAPMFANTKIDGATRRTTAKLSR